MDAAVLTLFAGFAVSNLTLMLFLHRQLVTRIDGMDGRLRTVENLVAALVERVGSLERRVLPPS